ncbi:MAG: FMN-binding protein [Oscillospiraceae bacterium]|nr:FMN-binding protein [Oscillospiraceae bacterium]
MKKRTKILLIIGGVFLVLVAVMFLAVTDGLREGMEIQLDGINLSGTADGIYTGTFEHKRWTNTVRVYVHNNEIIKIEVAGDAGGMEATSVSEEIFARVIAAQNTDVDAFSGATVTSNAYLKAIENALNG